MNHFSETEQETAQRKSKLMASAAYRLITQRLEAHGETEGRFARWSCPVCKKTTPYGTPPLKFTVRTGHVFPDGERRGFGVKIRCYVNGCSPEAILAPIGLTTLSQYDLEALKQLAAA